MLREMIPVFRKSAGSNYRQEKYLLQGEIGVVGDISLFPLSLSAKRLSLSLSFPLSIVVATFDAVVFNADLKIGDPQRSRHLTAGFKPQAVDKGRSSKMRIF